MTPKTSADGNDPVFIHGFAGQGEQWDEVRQLLEPSKRGIAVDLAGHGTNRQIDGPFNVERCGRDVAEMLPASSALLIGHSMGTRVVLEAAAQAPGRVSGLVLVDGSNTPADHAVIADIMRSSIGQNGAAAVMQRTMESFYLDNLKPERRAGLLAVAKMLPTEVAIDFWSSMAAWDTDRFTDCLDQVTCPVFVLQSTSVSPSNRLERYLIGDMPGSLWLDAWISSGKAHITRVPDCGHYTMIERPDLVASAIADITSRPQ